MATSRLFTALFCLFLPVLLVHGEDILRSKEPVTDILRKTAMPELVDSKVGKILTQYYKTGLGGEEKWNEVESFQLTGALEVESAELELVAYQKKPNLLKMELLHPESEIPVEFGFDGEVAWKKTARSGAEEMGPEESRRFIQNASFGSHLLFPFREGKQIKYIDTVPVDGEICHHIRVQKDNGYQVDYYIDIRTFLEAKVETTDTTNGFNQTIVYSDYSMDHGLPTAMTVENFEEGEWVSTLTIESINLNQGLMPWMFHMPKY